MGAKYIYKGNFRLIYRNANQISPFLRGNLQRWYHRFLLNQTDGVISVSNASKADLLKAFGFKKRIEVIPIGINPSEIDSKSSAVINIDLPASYLLHMGAWVPEKDPIGLLEMYSSVSKSNSKVIPLVFLGSGKLEFEMRNKIKSLGLGKSVFLIKNQRNPFPILKNANALLMPSKIEGLPGVILEAIFLKIPVIAYGVGGISEVLENKKTGWLVEAGDSQSFKESILQVINSPASELEKITAAAHSLVLKNYQIDQIAKEFERFYHIVIR